MSWSSASSFRQEKPSHMSSKVKLTHLHTLQMSPTYSPIHPCMNCYVISTSQFLHLWHVYEYMYVCPSDSQYHLKSLCIVTWKHGCPCVWHCVCVPAPHFCSPTLFRMYTCISTCIHIHLNPHFSLPSFAQLCRDMGGPCVAQCVFQSPHFWSNTLVRMCTCISTCIYVTQAWFKTFICNVRALGILHQ